MAKGGKSQAEDLGKIMKDGFMAFDEKMKKVRGAGLMKMLSAVEIRSCLTHLNCIP